MKQNILDQKAMDAIIRRAASLSPEASHLWGTMSAAQMLRHCNDAHQAILEAKPKPEMVSTLRQRIVKQVMLYMLPRLPKGIRGPQRFMQSSHAPDFESEKERFSHILLRFMQHTAPIHAVHPRAGRMSRRQWGIFVWMHADHHLRQFGV